MTAIGVTAVVAAAAFLAFRPQSGDELGEAAPFSLPDLRNTAGRVSLADRGDRPAVVNFFASWCAPCVKELPRLVEAERRYGDRVSFVGVAFKDSRSKAIELLEETGVPFPAASDPSGTLAQPYGISTGLPVTVFVGADGEVVERHLGELDAEELDDSLRELVGAAA